MRLDPEGGNQSEHVHLIYGRCSTLRHKGLRHALYAYFIISTQAKARAALCSGAAHRSTAGGR